MTAEFDWWLLILGLVVGAGLVWLILADLPRRDIEIDEPEIAVEAGWIAAELEATDEQVDAATVEAVLRAHREYLHLPPPDEAIEPEPSEASLAAVAMAATPSDGEASAADSSAPSS